MGRTTFARHAAHEKPEGRNPWAFGMCLALLACGALRPVLAQAPAAGRAEPAAAQEGTAARDPFKDDYRDYSPDFLPKIQRDQWQSLWRGFKKDEETMKLSSEPEFYTLNVVDEDARADALVAAGLQKERQGEYREALKIYQQVIDRHPRILHRVSKYGVFVPVAQYCQRRILAFPAADLAFYRTLHDARAKEAYEQAERRFSLAGLSDVAETMLATSYGGPALLRLGDAALDAGHFLAALESFEIVRNEFPDRALHTPELDLKIAYCRKMLPQSGAAKGTPPAKNAAGAQSAAVTRSPAAANGSNAAADGEEDEADAPVASQRISTAQQKPDAGQAANGTAERFADVVRRAVPDPPSSLRGQQTSPPWTSADDYAPMPPTADPLGLAEPVWKVVLPGSRDDFFVYSQPVVTADSVILRHKNLVTCRSILNGELRWESDLGGRRAWQNWGERQYPQEDLLVQDGLVFAPIDKGGPSLVAFDEITGQVRWAYGPMVAADEEQARMRFEAAPAGGPNTVFAAYVLDDIEGATHVDSEYGLIAFDSTTGRLLWRTAVCRLAPGKFAAGFAEQRRNRIRSFTSPPLYHEGTVYHGTNAGAFVAVDALSGRVKWLSRYPYYPEVHDATRVFGTGGEVVQYSRVLFRPHRPMFWYDQRPLLSGDRLFLTPVDGNALFCVDRRTGRIEWTKDRSGHESASYLLGFAPDGNVIVAHSGRAKQIDSWTSIPPVSLLDPATGRSVWTAPDLVLEDAQPVMRHYVFASPTLHYQIDRSWFETAARPFVTSDGRLHLASFLYVGYPIFGHVCNLGVLDLNERKIVAQRRFYSGEIVARAETDIRENGPTELKAFEENPIRTPEIEARMKMLREVIADTVPENAHGPFLPFSRVTCTRYGVPFELRISARALEMVYDRDKVRDIFEKRTDPAAEFALAELDVADNRLDEAVRRLERCLATISSEDLDFRAVIRQQLHRVHLRLARRAVRAGIRDDETTQVLGMHRTAGTLAEEIEALFAVADAYERQGLFDKAATALRTVVAVYGHHEYPISPLAAADLGHGEEASRGVLDRWKGLAGTTLFSAELGRTAELAGKGLPLYRSTVSPLPKTLVVRAGERAAARLARLQQESPEFAARFRTQAEGAFRSADESLARALLAEFPATPAAQQRLDEAAARAAALPGFPGRLLAWELADTARASGLVRPAALDPLLKPGVADRPEPAVVVPETPRLHVFTEEEEAARIVLQRRGDRGARPELLFVGSRVRKRLDNKFVVSAFDLNDGRLVWQTEELRLKGKGEEPGFAHAFVLGDTVVVHGLFDVLAFGLADGKVRWRHRVPFDFEIRSALLAGEQLVLSGDDETLALWIPGTDEAGTVAWRAREQGTPYLDAYVHGDRLVSLRKLPYAVTVRAPATGRLVGRLDLPDLSQNVQHPLLEDGPAELPVAVHGAQLAVTDGWYVILVDVDRLAVRWKRLLDENDVSREPPLRFAVGPEHVAVLKQNYDRKVLQMLSARTGEVLWETDPKDTRTPQPMYSLFVAGDRLFGIEPHPGQAYRLVARDANTGTALFRTDVEGYQAKPEAKLLPEVFGGRLVVRAADRQDFELRVFGAADGKPLGTLKDKGVAPWDVPGRVSATIQHGRPVLLSKDRLQQ